MRSRNCYAHFRLLVTLLICLVTAKSSNCDSFGNSNSSSLAVSTLREKSLDIPHLLQRQKRWLIFELGTSITLTANAAKALVDTIPRGWTLLYESTAIYDMPGAIEDWLPRRKSKPKPIPPPIPVPVKAPIPALPIPPPPPPAYAVSALPQQPVIVPLSPTDPAQPFYLSYPDFSPTFGQRRFYPRSGCPAANLAKDAYGNFYCQATAARNRLKRELEKNGANVLDQGQSPHGMLFDVLAMLSKMHQFQPRYCIMRTLCEARHLLAAPGQSLFHDIFRIMLRYVHTDIAHKPTYYKAFTSGHTLHECAQWYGAHCPHSFLLYFSEQFHNQYKNKY